jgi:hypothetical protein
MFLPKMSTYVDKEITRTILVMQEKEPDSKEYSDLLERLGRLQKIRQEEKPDQASTDTLLTVGANLLGIVLILRHEELNMITSKALQFVMRTR